MSVWQQKHEFDNTNARVKLIVLYTTQLIRRVRTTYVHLTAIIITSIVSIFIHYHSPYICLQE